MQAPLDLSMYTEELTACTQKSLRISTLQLSVSNRILQYILSKKGNLSWKDKIVHLGPGQMLLCGSKLRDTHFVYGSMLFTGYETKVMMNSIDPPSKRSTVEHQLDYIIIFFSFCCLYVCLQLVPWFLHSGCWQKTRSSIGTYSPASIMGRTLSQKQLSTTIILLLLEYCNFSLPWYFMAGGLKIDSLSLSGSWAGDTRMLERAPRTKLAPCGYSSYSHFKLAWMGRSFEITREH